MKARFALLVLATMAVVGLIVVALAGAAVAAPIAKNGRISACYQVKGKAKGAMRVVPPNKKCRKGERKLAWNVAGPAGQAGTTAPAGPTGSNGAAGTQGSAGNEAELQAKIAGLTLKVESLEGVLKGLTNGDLTKAVGAVPAVTALCAEASALPGQVNNALGDAFDGLSLEGVIPIGLVLKVPNLTSVPAFTC